jgi:hypothetical protein
MSLFNVALGPKGLANIPQSKEGNDFTFVIGDMTYSCPWYVAAFLSPKICALYQIDSTTKEFVVHTEDGNHNFEAFLSLGDGAQVVVSSSNLDFFCSVSEEFENIELLQSIENVLEGDLDVRNVLRRLRLMKRGGLDICEAVNFAASHFSEFDSSALDTLSCEELELIVSHMSLKFEREEDLCELIIRRMEADLCYASLFEFVHFEYVSNEAVDRFWTVISDHFDLLNPSIWSHIRQRLVSGISTDGSKKRRSSKVFHPVEANPLDGIVGHLTREHGGNVHTQGIVTVTGYDCLTDESCYAALNAADLTAPNTFWSKNQPNQSLVYDFGDRRIRLTHYSIRSRHDGGVNDHYLRSWVIETSVDGEAWPVVDRHEDDVSLKGANASQLFPLREETTECRFVRLRHIGTNHHSPPYHYLVISGFELFGSLIE